jgi:hypothetical protein
LLLSSPECLVVFWSQAERIEAYSHAVDQCRALSSHIEEGFLRDHS